MLLATDSHNTVLVESKPGVINGLAYTVYGVQSARQPVSSTLSFNGEHRDGLTQGYHLGHGHRVYNPVLMRFVTPDALSPFGAGGCNAYAYCQGDPVNRMDPTGQFIVGLTSVFSLTETVMRHTKKIAQAFFSTRPSTYKSRVYQAAYTAIGTATVMSLAGVASGSIVVKTGLAMIATVDSASKIQKTLKTLRATPLGRGIASRLGFAPSSVQLEEIVVGPGAGPSTQAIPNQPALEQRVSTLRSNV